MMNTDEVTRFEKRLLAMREVLQRRVIDELAESANGNFNEIVGQVRDSADESSAEQTANKNLTLLQREVDELSDVAAALERIRDGSYGACFVCGGDIERQRLEAAPAAKRCVECQRMYERVRATNNPVLRDLA